MPEWAIQVITGLRKGPPHDFGQHHAEQSKAVAMATKAIGWDGRELIYDSTVEHYRWQREASGGTRWVDLCCQGPFGRTIITRDCSQRPWAGRYLRSPGWSETTMSKNVIMINRAPVLTLWAAVVAERLGYDGDAALTLGKCVAGLTAQTKGRMLGIYGPPKAGPHGDRPKKTGLGEDSWIQLCGRGVPAKTTPEGVRAVVKDRPIDPAAVAKYLTQKFGDGLDAAREAMDELAAAFEPEQLDENARGLYEEFRPEIPRGKRGWGAKGPLDLALIRSLGAHS